MGDEDRRAPAHQRLEAVEQLRLGGGVEAGGGLVEQEHRRVAQQRAGDPDPLALAAGERDALRAEPVS